MNCVFCGKDGGDIIMLVNIKDCESFMTHRSCLPLRVLPTEKRYKINHGV
jgi:hypothetical protein